MVGGWDNNTNFNNNLGTAPRGVGQVFKDSDYTEAEEREIERANLISDGVIFLRTLSRYYGAEKGMDLWAKMNEVLDDDVAQDVFMNMLGAGESGTTFRMQYGRCDVKVTAIKAVRQATGLGLKDAKELVEESQVQPARVQCQTAKEAIGLRKDLREIGMYIS